MNEQTHNDDLADRLDLINDIFEDTGQTEDVYLEPESKGLMIVECCKGHRYKIDYSMKNYKAQIARGCAICRNLSYKTKCEQGYNLNLLNYQYLLDNIPEFDELKRYELHEFKFNELDKIIEPKNITITSDKTIYITVKEGNDREYNKLAYEEYAKKHKELMCDDSMEGIISNYISYIYKRYNHLEKFKIQGIKNVIDYDKDNYNSKYPNEKLPLIDVDKQNYYTYYFGNFFKEIRIKEITEFALNNDSNEHTKSDYNKYNKNCLSDIYYLTRLFRNERVEKVLNEPDFKKRMLLENQTPQKIKVYRQKELDANKYVYGKEKEIRNQKKIDELTTKIEELRLQKDNINQEISDLYSAYEKVAKKKYVSSYEIQHSLLDWCKKPDNKDIGNIIMNQFLPRKNKYKLDQIDIDSDETIYIKGNRGATYKTTAKCITEERRVLPKLPRGTSYPELFIYYYFKMIYTETIHRGKAPGNVEYDITIPEKKTCIEYNGCAFHKGKYAKPEKDASKVELCKKYGVNYIRIEDDGEAEEPKINDWIISYKYNANNKSKQLEQICKLIVKEYLHEKEQEISIEDIEEKIRLFY